MIDRKGNCRQLCVNPFKHLNIGVTFPCANIVFKRGVFIFSYNNFTLPFLQNYLTFTKDMVELKTGNINVNL